MDNNIRTVLRSLELQNESKAQELAVAYSRIADLENQIGDLTGTDASYVAPEDQTAFIRKIAESSSKFSKEAQDIIDVLDANASRT
jgi:adenylylsulfate kinase-like enzyme